MSGDGGGGAVDVAELFLQLPAQDPLVLGFLAEGTVGLDGLLAAEIGNGGGEPGFGGLIFGIHLSGRLVGEIRQPVGCEITGTKGSLGFSFLASSWLGDVGLYGLSRRSGI